MPLPREYIFSQYLLPASDIFGLSGSIREESHLIEIQISLTAALRGHKESKSPQGHVEWKRPSSQNFKSH